MWKCKTSLERSPRSPKKATPVMLIHNRYNSLETRANILFTREEEPATQTLGWIPCTNRFAKFVARGIDSRRVSPKHQNIQGAEAWMKRASVSCNDQCKNVLAWKTFFGHYDDCWSALRRNVWPYVPPPYMFTGEGRIIVCFSRVIHSVFIRDIDVLIAITRRGVHV